MSKQKLLILTAVLTVAILLAGRYLLARSFLDITNQDDPEAIHQEDIQELPGNNTTDRLNKEDTQQPTAQKEKEILVPTEHNTAQKDTTQKISPDKEMLSETIKILIPHFVSPTNLLQLTKHINEEYDTDIRLSIVQVEHLPAYQEALKNTQEYDILLAPSHWMKSLQDKVLSLPFDPSIGSLFHAQIATYMRDQEMTRLPYSLDPILTLSPEQVSKPGKAASRDDVSRYVLTHPAESKLPFGLGFSEIERKFVEADRYPLMGIQQRRSLIISAARQNKNTGLLDMLSPNEQWNFRDIYSLTQKPPYDTNNTCQSDIIRCLTDEDQVQITRDLLSQVDQEQGLHLSALPNSYTLDSVARGRSVPDSLIQGHEEAVTTRLRGYLQLAHEGSPNDWEQSLSAFNRIRNQQLLDFQYTHISLYIQDNNLTIVEGSLDDWDMWIDQTPLLDVLMGEYNAGLWID